MTVLYRRRSETEIFGLSFLDVISAGFGAIVMLLLLTKTAEPTIVKERGQGLEALALQLQAQLPAVEERIQNLEAQLAKQRSRQEEASRRLAQMEQAVAAVRAARAETELETEAAATIEQRLAEAKQTLTEEMKRLYGAGYRRVGTTIGGIPVDSEFIIFVIDTSGSMQRFAWSAMIDKMAETLDIYPEVKGLQVMSDMGDYMFPQYRSEWIPDTPARRRAVLERLRTWHPFSNSSPVEGIVAAIRTFHAEDKRISIYVLGDEFTGPSIESVIQTVARINPKDADGNPRVRIHGVGFPTQFTNNGIGITGIRFATLMRALTRDNGGTFVALHSSR